MVENVGITKATPIEFDRTMGTGVVFEQIIGGCLRHAGANAPLIKADTPEAVHQTRVGLRRARSAIWLFKDHLDKKARKLLAPSLQSIGQQLGPVRDWDVFVAETLPKLARREKPERVTRLREAAEVKRVSAYQDLKVEIPEPPLCKMLAEGFEPFTPISTTAPDMLDRAYYTVRRASRHVDTPAQRHDLRKAMKKLRYGIEFFTSLYDNKGVRNFLDPCKEMQGVLGEINDTQTMLHLLQELDGTVPSDWIADTEHRGGRAVDHLDKRITEFRAAKPFWD